MQNSPEQAEINEEQNDQNENALAQNFLEFQKQQLQLAQQTGQNEEQLIQKLITLLDDEEIKGDIPSELKNEALQLLQLKLQIESSSKKQQEQSNSGSKKKETQKLEASSEKQIVKETEQQAPSQKTSAQEAAEQAQSGQKPLRNLSQSPSFGQIKARDGILDFNYNNFNLSPGAKPNTGSQPNIFAGIKQSPQLNGALSNSGKANQANDRLNYHQSFQELKGYFSNMHLEKISPNCKSTNKASNKSQSPQVQIASGQKHQKIQNFSNFTSGTNQNIKALDEQIREIQQSKINGINTVNQLRDSLQREKKSLEDYFLQCQMLKNEIIKIKRNTQFIEKDFSEKRKQVTDMQQYIKEYQQQIESLKKNQELLLVSQKQEKEYINTYLVLIDQIKKETKNETKNKTNIKSKLVINQKNLELLMHKEKQLFNKNCQYIKQVEQSFSKYFDSPQ